MKKLLSITILLFSFNTGCDDKAIPVENCGDGVIDVDEECEGTNFYGHSCQGFGFYSGDLVCNEFCLIETSGCAAEGGCGDGIVQVDFDEDCDEGELSGETCFSLGYYGGELGCGDTCRFDLTGCETHGICGDGRIQGGYGEECDLGSLDGTTCESFGYHGGNLSCDDNCQYNLSGCEITGRCGDSELQVAFEECDGGELGGASCESKGYNGGTLNCDNTCNFDLSECTECGDGSLDPGEECEPGQFGSNTCDTLGYYGGALSCNVGSCTFNLGQCEGFGQCGDNIIQATYGEECEGADLNGMSCSNLPASHMTYGGGPLVCGNACLFDLSNCERCGDGIINGGEVCDGTDIGDNSCITGGNVTCIENCLLSSSNCDSIVKIGQGSFFTCGLTSGGLAYCWGHNTFGQLGNGTNINHLIPTAVSQTGVSFASITAGGFHACGLTNLGEAYCWGRNDFGQSGDGTSIDQNIPTAVSQTGISFTNITAGIYHTCGLTSTGLAYCWGKNDYGQSGDSTSTELYVPTAVTQTGISFTSITAGGFHTCGLTSTGLAYCWGKNSDGQLGDDTTTDRNIPTAVSQTGISFKNIITGGSHTCGLTSAGLAYCWGWNISGQLGIGTYTTYLYIPTAVAQTGISFTSMTAFNNHTCGITSTGLAYCWGHNNYGQVGDSTSANKYSVPTAVAQAEISFTSINTGDQHTCGITSAGVSYCWGLNNYGQLGDGTTTDHNVPTAILTMF
jgi:alpha-tubulin suppressor-like RCC1 family protein